MIKIVLNKDIWEWYPTDLYPEITKEQWNKIDKVLEEKFGFGLARVSANITRIMLKKFQEISKDTLPKEELKKFAKEILEKIDCPEVNECEDYEEAYEMLVKHLKEVKQIIKTKARILLKN